MELLSVEGLKKHFSVKSPVGGSAATLRAVDGVDFSVADNSVYALVGESGCGKSTVARLILRLLEPTAGRVRFRGSDISGLDRTGMRTFRKSVQIVFQDPFASLNPRRTVFDTIAEPLAIHNIVPKSQSREKAVEILASVGLGPETLSRYPHQFSGGQRQRICIARALSVSPELIIADEPLSALDVSIQAQIINLLTELKERSRISYLLISHDLRVVHYLSDTVGVMYLGRIVEQAKTEELFSHPLHPYTELLLASAPRLQSDGRGRSAPLAGEVPSPVAIPQGCPFHPRCPKRFEPCDRVVPVLGASQGRLVSCHLWNPY